MQRLLVAKKHPPNLTYHFHSDHLLSPALKLGRGSKTPGSIFGRHNAYIWVTFRSVSTAYYSTNQTIQSVCCTTELPNQSLVLENESIFYIPKENLSQRLSIDKLNPMNGEKSVNLNESATALLLGSANKSKDRILLLPDDNNPYSFLDVTGAWASKNEGIIRGGEILAIKDDKNTICWLKPNHQLLDSKDLKWKELRDELAGDVISIREVKKIEIEQVTTVFTKSPAQQKIIFGPPGTGKSYSVKKIQEDLKVNDTPENKGIFRTTFHPEYSYGDFVAKLLPLTVKEIIIGDDGRDIVNTRVEYQIHAGPFIQTLAKALAYPGQHFLLVIDEINRGNCAAIFGDIFQLLDRKDDGNSEYEIDPSELTRLALQQVLQKLGKSEIEAKSTTVGKLFIPANISMIATMNTSDESVFYMDSAFKRRWQFQYIGPDDHEERCKKHANSENDNKCPLDCKEGQQQNAIIMKKNDAGKFDEIKVTENSALTWKVLRKVINKFLLDKRASVRRIEDKQLGLWFIKADKTKGEIAPDDIKFKLMHFLWDNVFARDKTPLSDLVYPGNEAARKNNGQINEFVTFGDFVKESEEFINQVIKKYN